MNMTKEPKNERQAHAVMATDRVIPAWQKPAPVRAVKQEKSILRKILGL